MDSPETVWESFKKYSHANCKVSERPGIIEFGFKEFSQKRFGIFCLIALIIILAPPVVLSNTARNSSEGLTVGLFLMLPAMMVAAIVFGLLLAIFGHRNGALVIRRGTVAVDTVETRSEIDIKSISDVSVGATRRVLIMDTNVPVSTIPARDVDSARSIAIGVRAAIAVLNPQHRLSG